MGDYTKDKPKCMSDITQNETIVSRQLRLLYDEGITEVIMTTGAFYEVLENYLSSLEYTPEIKTIYNPRYQETNYIYSIFNAKEYLCDSDIILMHGDLVFDKKVLHDIVSCDYSCIAIDSTLPLPQKDFKAKIEEDRVTEISVDIFDQAVAAQPLYHIKAEHFSLWMPKIEQYCKNGNTGVYAENALNEVIGSSSFLKAYDVQGKLCSEVDTMEELRSVSKRIESEEKTVYVSFSTDVIHTGHLDLIKHAREYGKVIAGVLSDKAVASYKRFPLVPFEERLALISNIRGVEKAVCQKELSYAENLRELKPDYVIHGDDWKEGIQRPIRDEVIEVLKEYGGELIEFPYHTEKELSDIEARMRADLSIPDFRRGRLKKLLSMKGCVNAIEAHSGITGLIAEKTMISKDGAVYQFDAMWISSLCDSTAKGKPDIELVDMTSRFRTIDDIMEVTTKPIIFDGDTGGLIEHFIYTVRTLERMGVSMIIIEDKTGLKKNSLFGTDVKQTQDSIEHFCEKLSAGKRAKKTEDFMIVARIESLILEQGMEDALKRAFAYVEAGADGIMIHSRKKEPDEIFEFVDRFRQKNTTTPLVIVPTTFNQVTEEEWKSKGVNVVIYANQLTRSGFPAMKKVAETILENHRAKEADDMCMPIKEILTLIPEDTL